MKVLDGGRFVLSAKLAKSARRRARGIAVDAIRVRAPLDPLIAAVAMRRRRFKDQPNRPARFRSR